MTEHHYSLSIEWTGNLGSGTSTRRAYSRDHDIRATRTTTIEGSSDPAFRGDPTRWNPEQLLVASLAQCHMLWYLDLATRAGIVVVAYSDEPRAVMDENEDGSGQFSHVTLQPNVTIGAGDLHLAEKLHAEVSGYCFIARSVSFPVHHEPSTRRAASTN